MISRDDVYSAYRYLLGREPEGEETVADILASTGSLAELRERILRCDEFLTRAQVSESAAVRLGNYVVPVNWPVTGESSRNFCNRLNNGFFAAYLCGDTILDIGFRGQWPDAVPVLPHAIGVDLDFPGYDGRVLPFHAQSIDGVYSSHLLQHIADPVPFIRDWYRVLRVGGCIVCIVPHQFLYEKKYSLPSRYNLAHKRFYTPGALLQEFEMALEPNSYRIRHLRDNDAGYTYELGPDLHPGGTYEIELVIEKRQKPDWDLAP